MEMTGGYPSKLENAKVEASDLSGEKTLDFNKEGDIVVGAEVLRSAVDGEAYKRAIKKQRKLAKKLKRQSIILNAMRKGQKHVHHVTCSRLKNSSLKLKSD